MRFPIRLFHHLILLLSLTCLAQAQSTQSVTSIKKEEFKCQTNCTRNFIYRGRTFSVDSSRKMDGEGLRRALKTNPQSEEILNRYQSNLKVSRITAYTGTFGLLTFIGGPLYSTQIENPTARNDVRKVSLYAGATLLIGSYLFGKWNYHSNERTLQSAVDVYNNAASQNDRITVDLTPTATGDGGQIKTIVPFAF